MKRKETYLSRDFRETVALRFPAQAKELNTAFDMRLMFLTRSLPKKLILLMQMSRLPASVSTLWNSCAR